MAKKKYYAVKKGKNTGIYTDWEACKDQVQGYSGAVYKGFKTEAEAREYLSDGDLNKKAFKEAIGSIDTSWLAEDELMAYVDGSYRHKDKSFSYGLLLLDKERIETYSQRFIHSELSTMRNVAGELKGALVAMDRALALNKRILYLYYDYAGIEKWARGEWKTNKEGTKAYRQAVKAIEGELQIVFNKVEAHSGDSGNELADTLAKEADFELNIEK